MQLLDGKQTSEAIKADLKEKVDELKAKGHRPPHLSAILVGENPASMAYVGNKMKSCEQIGFQSSLNKFETSISEEDLLAEIEKLNQDPSVDGYIVQLPLPDHISEDKVIEQVDPAKDVDGFHPVNVGKMVAGLPTFLPATPFGITKLMEHYNLSANGKEVVVIGRSHIVGRPMSILLSQSSKVGNGTVTVCHSRTPDLEFHTKRADILIVALGKPGYVTAEMVKEGAIVIDVGINRIPDASRKSGSRLVGDVDFDSVSTVASHLTPVPRGVGPMTIAGLMLNCYQAALNRINS